MSPKIRRGELGETIRTPDIDAVPPDENTRSVGVGFHRLRHAVLEVLLVRRVLDDGHDEGIEVGQRARSAGDAHAFDHLRASLPWTICKEM